VTIRSFAPGALASQRTSDMFVSMRRELDSLHRQLATGLKSETFGGLGFERRSSLDVRGKMAMLDGYNQSIAGASVRMKLMIQVTERLDALGRETRSGLLASGFDVAANGTGRNLAEQRMREALDHLNKEVNGRYMFAGRSTEAAPVESYERIMDGDSIAGQAGLRTVIADRASAELGVDGLGRLSTAVQAPVAPATSPYTMQITGNGPGFPFGFELVSTSATGLGITGGAAAGSPEQVGLTVNAVPAENDTVRVVLRDKDGATYTIQLAARTNVTAGERGVFQIGADQDATVNGPNGLRAAIETAIRDKAIGVLKPRAEILAAEEFFAGTNAAAPARVAFAPPRVTASVQPGDTARVAGDLSNLGFRLMGTSTDTSALIDTTFTPAVAGPPAAAEYVDFQLTGVPVDGDTVVLQLQDHAGAPRTITLTARTTPTGPNDFQIGGTAAATVGGANGLVAALTRTLATSAETLSPAEATAMDATGTRATLLWYKGDDATTPSARDTAPLRIGQSQVVGTGARANEPAIRSFLAQIGLLSQATFANTDAERERYQNLSSRVADKLAPPLDQPRLEVIAAEFQTANAAMDGAKERHRTASSLLQDTLDGVEQASTEETAATMLNLQTRLQASYQTTSMLSQLSLVNYL
jgi:flagellin-like hook-associated protein FlgL